MRRQARAAYEGRVKLESEPGLRYYGVESEDVSACPRTRRLARRWIAVKRNVKIDHGALRHALTVPIRAVKATRRTSPDLSRAPTASARDRFRKPAPLGFANVAHRGGSYDQPAPKPQGSPKRMLEQVRRDIKNRLDELLGEADKLRRALAALGSRESAAAPSASSPPKVRSRRSDSHSTSRTATPKSARLRANATTAATARSRQPAKAPAAASGRAKSRAARAAPGATKSAILAALATDSAMTAGEIATATGLGRATVSTTLSRLAKTGEVTKAPRGYQITKQTSTPAAADATGSADSRVAAT